MSNLELNFAELKIFIHFDFKLTVMKILLMLFVFGFAYHVSFAQIEDKNPGATKNIEIMPEFPGGQEALYQYLSENVHYPDSAIKYKKEALVKVRFLILEDGSVDSVRTKEKFGFGLNEEAERVVKEMPKWIPGKNGDMPIRVYLQVPIKFTMSIDEKENRTNKKPQSK
jgi:TonB family protein